MKIQIINTSRHPLLFRLRLFLAMRASRLGSFFFAAIYHDLRKASFVLAGSSKDPQTDIIPEVFAFCKVNFLCGGKTGKKCRDLSALLQKLRQFHHI